MQPLDKQQLEKLAASPELVKFLTEKTPVPAQPNNPPAAFDAKLFKTANRIHSDVTSIITHDHFLVVHPNELKPENLPRLQEKIFTHYTIPEPHFFSVQPQSSIALLMGSFIPVSLDAEKEKLLEDLQALYEKSKTGQHPKLVETRNRYDKPYAAHIKRWSEESKTDPVGREYMQHALAVYLLIEEAFKRPPVNLTQPLASYVRHMQSPDSLIANLCTHLKIDPQHFQKTSMEKGAKGIAELLNIDAVTTADIEAVSALAAQNRFAQNLIESWKEGRKHDPMRKLSLDDALKIGTVSRIQSTVARLQKDPKANAKQREETSALEDTLVKRLSLLPTEVQEALYYTGTDIIASAEPNVSRAFGGHASALGLHLHASYEPGKTNGIRQVYISRTQKRAERDRYLFHEVHHMVFPEKMPTESVEQIDALLEKEITRLKALNTELTNWQKASPAEKQAIEARIESQFAAQGISLSKILEEERKNGRETAPIMDRLCENVDYALQNFDPHSKELARGYVIPELRAAEIISRYAELRFSILSDRPDLLNFIAPEMKVIYEQHYLPHVRKEVEALKSQSAATPKAPTAAGVIASLASPVTPHETPLPPATLIVTDNAHALPLKGVPAPVIAELQKINAGGTFVERASADTTFTNDVVR